MFVHVQKHHVLSYDKQRQKGNSTLHGFWFNTEHFWELTLADLILIGADWLLAGLMAIFYKIGKRLRGNYDKLTRPRKTFNVQQIQSKPLERIQSASVIREQRIEPCGTCADRRRRAIDLPTTMPKNNPKRSYSHVSSIVESGFKSFTLSSF